MTAGAGSIQTEECKPGVRRDCLTDIPSRESIMGSLVQDLHFTLRSLRRRPLFAVVAIITMALGIGATTAIYSIVDGVLLRPLPFRDSSRPASPSARPVALRYLAQRSVLQSAE